MTNESKTKNNPRKKILTTNAGIPIPDNQNTLTAGPKGPVLLEDFMLLEKLAQFNRERIPERVVHAKGSGAKGYFCVTRDISRYTKAKLFSDIGKKTPLLIRFSTVAGERGYPDTDRDPRGFAIKFYTEEGNWDMVGNNTPVFFLRDPLKFPDFIHTQKRDPKTNLRNPTAVWDFFSLSPESLHQITTLFSERGIPNGYRAMHGFSSHTFSLINAQGERVWCKWHFKSKQGIHNLSPTDATRIAGEDPDYAQRDLLNAIETGNFPKWKVCVQIMPEHEASTYRFNPFDLTKVWSQKDYPLIEVGEIVLDKNPDNYFADIEQAAFEPSNIVPGMGFSPDKMLQGRLMAYPDAHRYRIGTNYAQLPINAPRCPYHNHQRDGHMRFDDNGGAAPHYEPNSFDEIIEKPAAKNPALALSGNADRYDHRIDKDYYTQAGDLFRLLSQDSQQHLIENLAKAMQSVPCEIQIRQIRHFYQADPAYGEGVARLLGIDVTHINQG